VRKKTPSNPLFDEINIFINNHYEFKCNKNYKGFFGRIRAFADRTEAEEREKRESGESWLKERHSYYSDPVSEEKRKRDTERSIAALLESSFSATLMKYIDDKGINPVDVYKKANIDRRLFSKIRNEQRYIPSKRTAIALAIALELSLDETRDLLKRAGFSLSRSLLFDVIIEYFIMKGIYDIYEINDVLFSYDLPVLGG